MARSAHPARGFHARSLPVEILQPGVILFRSHHREHHPLHFSVGHTLNRFDDPAGEFGVCYCARTAEGAFAETFLRQRTGGLVDLEELSVRARAELVVTRPLRLVPFYGAGLAKLGATAEVTAGPVAPAQHWASAIYHHSAAPDGILYRVRHDNDQIGVALFDREKPSISWLRSELWRHADLDSICKRYALALI